MSLVSLECRYIIERIRSIAFQVGAFLGDDSQYNREQQAKKITDILDASNLDRLIPPLVQTILYGEYDIVKLESTQFFEMLRYARQYFTQEVLDGIQIETERPRASFMVLKRRILDVEAQFERKNTILRVDFVVDKERYPIRLSYKMPKQGFLLNEWLAWFNTTTEQALTANGDFLDSLKDDMRGRSLCFLKYFREYKNDRPVFWTYNRLHTVREGLIDLFHHDVSKGYLPTYQPQLWKRETFDNIRQFLRRDGCPEKFFCLVGRKTFVLDSSLSERDIFISLQSGKSERIQGILNAQGLSLRSTENFVAIQQLLQRLDRNPMAELSRLGRESKHCTVCNRKLDSDSSIAKGMGPVCASKIQSKMIQQSLF